MGNIAIRGATTIEKNNEEEILKASEELIKVIIEQNKIEIGDIISIVFTATKDITKAYPARAARNLGIKDAALMCVQEMYVEDSLEMCIRVMVQVKASVNNIRHVYLKGAKQLRPDLLQTVQIAIDGPAGAGKSTIAKKVADELGYIYIDTGAMYRALGYYCSINNIDINNEFEVVEKLENLDLEIKNKGGKQLIYVNKEEITDLIRGPEVSKMASIVAGYNKVRVKMVEMQRELAKEESVVMDGRDIGTHVLADAQVKIFLTASVLERAKRRLKDLKEKGYKVDLKQISKEIEARDYNDSNREVSPLEKATDAIELDTTSMSIKEVTQEILKLI